MISDTRLQHLLNSDTTIVFTFGYTGAGKSTLILGLYEYLFKHHRVRLNPNGNREGAKYISTCAKALRKDRKLPEVTTINTVYEIDWLSELDSSESIFTFLDIAGENFRTVDFTEEVSGKTNPGELDEIPKKYLQKEGSQLPIILLCVLDCERVDEQDFFINTFLNYAQTYNFSFLAAAVIVTKWDNKPENHSQVEAFLKTKAHQTCINLEHYVENLRFFPFSIGTINQADPQIVDTIDFSYCHDILKWLHQVSENKPMFDTNETNTLDFLKFVFESIKSFPLVFK